MRRTESHGSLTGNKNYLLATVSSEAKRKPPMDFSKPLLNHVDRFRSERLERRRSKSATDVRQSVYKTKIPSRPLNCFTRPLSKSTPNLYKPSDQNNIMDKMGTHVYTFLQQHNYPDLSLMDRSFKNVSVKKYCEIVVFVGTFLVGEKFFSKSIGNKTYSEIISLGKITEFHLPLSKSGLKTATAPVKYWPIHLEFLTFLCCNFQRERTRLAALKIVLEKKKQGLAKWKAYTDDLEKEWNKVKSNTLKTTMDDIQKRLENLKKLRELKDKNNNSTPS